MSFSRKNMFLVCGVFFDRGAGVPIFGNSSQKHGLFVEIRLKYRKYLKYLSTNTHD